MRGGAERVPRKGWESGSAPETSTNRLKLACITLQDRINPTYRNLQVYPNFLLCSQGRNALGCTGFTHVCNAKREQF